MNEVLHVFLLRRGGPIEAPRCFAVSAARAMLISSTCSGEFPVDIKFDGIRLSFQVSDPGDALLPVRQNPPRATTIRLN